MRFNLKLILALVIITQVGCAQLLTKIAKEMAPPAPTTATLNNVVPTIVIGSNLHPAELGTIAQSFFSGWKAGGDQVAIIFLNEKGVLKIDGTVTVDGVPAEYIVAGTYSLISGANTAPRKVEIITATGEKSSFTIKPNAKQIKVVSINGRRDNISLDLTKDVVIEFEGTRVPENELLKVSLAINQVGIKSIYDVAYIRKSGSKITVPAAAFRNINIKPGASALYNYKNSFLSVGVENTERATDVSGSFPAVSYTSSYSDGKFVTVGTEPNLNTGLIAKGKEKLADGEMNYDFLKPNAFTSRPADQIKKIGVISFAIKGKTLAVESVIDQEKSAKLPQVIKNTIVTFPIQTNEVWDAILAKMYPQLMAIVQSELNATVLPIEAAPKTNAYKSIESFSKEDVNTKAEFSRAYRGTKVLSAVPHIREGLGVNGVYERMMNEAGVDALMTMTLDLEAKKDGDFGVMVPKLDFEILGKANGPIFGTKYFSGTIVGKGIPSEDIGLKIEFQPDAALISRNKTFHTAGVITSEELDKIIRRSDLLTVFTKGLKEIKEKEKANGDYETVWNLQ